MSLMYSPPLFLDQMFELSIALDLLHFTCDKAWDLLLHALIARFDSLAETIGGVFFSRASAMMGGSLGVGS